MKLITSSSRKTFFVSRCSNFRHTKTASDVAEFLTSVNLTEIVKHFHRIKLKIVAQSSRPSMMLLISSFEV